MTAKKIYEDTEPKVLICVVDPSNKDADRIVLTTPMTTNNDPKADALSMIYRVEFYMLGPSSPVKIGYTGYKLGNEKD